VKLGGGTLTLTGANTYTGGAAINAGNVCVMSTIGDVVVRNGGTLSGAGTVGNVNVDSGGTLSPGDNGGDGIGTLHVKNLTLSSGAFYYADIANSGWDTIDAAGAIDLGEPTLSLRGSRTPVVGEALALILDEGIDSISGSFYGLSENDVVSLASVNYRVTYQHDSGDSKTNDMAIITQ
jgi:autotransporter-associated beta strand protein